MKKVRGIYFPLIISLIFIFAAIIFDRNFKFGDSEKITKKFQATILEKEEATAKIVTDIFDVFDLFPDQTPNTEEINALITEKDVEILVYSKDSLKFWSDNKIPGKIIYDRNLFKNSFTKFKNAYFEIIKLEKNEIKIIGLILIKHEYPYQNKYLLNNFQSDFNVPSETIIKNVISDNIIFSKEGEKLFSLKFNNDGKISESNMFFLFFLYLIGFLFFAFFLFKLYYCLSFFKKNKVLFFIFYSLDLIIFKGIIQYFQIPKILYKSKLFDPEIFSYSLIFPSLGDLLINSIILLLISYVVYFAFSRNYNNDSKIKRFLISVFCSAFVFLMFYLLGFLSKNLILFSNFSLNINDYFSLDIYSFIGFFTLAILIISFFIFTSKLCSIAIRNTKSYSIYLAQTILISILAVVIFYYCGLNEYFIVLFAFVFCQILWVFQKRDKSIFSFSVIVVNLLIFSLFSSIILHQNNKIKEIIKSEKIAQKLYEKRNKNTELLFHAVSSIIKSDTNIVQKLESASVLIEDENVAVKLVSNKFINSYWKKYDILITICYEEKVLNIQPENFLVGCNDYFEEILLSAELVSEVDDFYYCKKINDSRKYISAIRFFQDINNKDQYVTIYIELFSNLIPEGLGYAELLLDKENIISYDLSEYSYAKYRDGKLEYKFGNYQYSLKLDNYFVSGSIPSNFRKNYFNHRYYKIDKNTDLLLSHKAPNFLDSIAPFSYLLVFYSLVVLMIFAIVYFPFYSNKLSITFRNRLQFSIISIIFVSFLVIGTATLLYLINLNDEKNHDILKEKAHSVLIELEHKLADEEYLSVEMEEYLSSLLTKFSLVFFSDINLYNLDGNLIATSRSKIFDEGLISEKMNPLAFKQLTVNKKTLITQREKIGNYEYLSAYVPFINSNNELIAYLNLPYFARQNELLKEISTFLIAFFNIYVLLFAIAIFVTILISRYITKPLQLIKEKISRIKLGKNNEKIDWKRKDEIGALISEYNRMIDEMERSAELLARSEREGAWREMAKQVAHEIKNPLTPMKLSTQYLQKAWDDKAPDWDKRLKSFTRTLTEQIETLSSIASGFSDFAKMPISKIEKIELVNIIQNSITIFKDRKKYKIELKYPETQKFYILGDKNQMLRVFNNLIKNSIQAINQMEFGNIEIEISSHGNEHIVKVSDDGRGISKEQKSQIFSPSFTTKSSGTGLGLSIVKSIISEAGGTISFKSEEGKGTTFEIRLPDENK